MCVRIYIIIQVWLSFGNI